MAFDFAGYTATFLKFAESFETGSDDDCSAVRLKIDHSLRVVENARTIIENIALERQVGETALLAALFHDIGRFPQYQRYKTFNDSISVNHGHLGVKILKKQHILSDLPCECQRQIFSAIALHNKNQIPGHVSPELGAICKVVRDSDKLDIFKVMLKHFSEEANNHKIALEAVPHPDNYTPKMYENVFYGKPCLYKDIYWTNDFKLILADWSYHLSFPISYRLFYDSGMFDKIFEHLPQKKEFHVLKKKLLAVITQERTP
jgi:putative nucleotidyltransferase with HDIG domain